jgi:hypothetical protein
MILPIRPFLLGPALASLSIASGLHAQARCVDPLAGASWRSTPLTARIESPAPGERAVDRYVTGFLPLLGQSFHDPNAGSMRDGAMVTVPPAEGRAEIRATMTVTLDRNGRVLSAQLSAGTGIAKLDSALVQGVRGAGNGRGFGKAPRQFRGDTLSVTIGIFDRAPAAPRTAALGSYSTSYLVADVPPRIRTMPPARAPRGRRGREVTLAATVSAEGRVVPGTIRVVSTNDSSLIAVARNSLERSVYRPGTKNGCPAESNIRQRFPFP